MDILKLILLLSLLGGLISCEPTGTAEVLEFDDSGVAEVFNKAQRESLYKVNCASCHGDLHHSTKLNKSASEIKDAIKKYTSMNSLSKLSDEALEAIALSLDTSPPVIPSPEATDSIIGAEIYQSHCAGCHRELSVSNKHNRNFTQIKNAIAQNSIMVQQEYLKLLTDVQLSAVATALVKKYAPGENPGTSELNQIYVIGTRRFVVSKLETLYVNDSANAVDNLIKADIQSLVGNNQNADFGGACNDYNDDCPGSSQLVQNGGLMNPTATTVRRGYMVRVCRLILDKSRAVSNVLERAGLTTASPMTSNNIDLVFDVHSPGMTLSTEARSDLINIYTTGKQNGLDSEGAWRMVLSALCESSMFELY